MSPVIPSLKYSSCGSPLKLVKGEGQNGDGWFVGQGKSRTRCRGNRCGGSGRTQGQMLHKYNHGGDERQSRKREHASAPALSQGPVLRLGRCASGGPALHHHPVHTDRLGDVLDRLCAEVLVSKREFVFDLRVDG